jgi:hypothetical protein
MSTILGLLDLFHSRVPHTEGNSRVIALIADIEKFHDASLGSPRGARALVYVVHARLSGCLLSTSLS